MNPFICPRCKRSKTKYYKNELCVACTIMQRNEKRLSETERGFSGGGEFNELIFKTYLSDVRQGKISVTDVALAPTQLGLGTDRALVKAMPDLIDARFTAQMEERLDDIARGKLSWEHFLCDWNESYFKPALIKAQSALVGVTRVNHSTKISRSQTKSKEFKRHRKRSARRRLNSPPASSFSRIKPV